MSDLEPLKSWCAANKVHYVHARRLAADGLLPIVRLGRRLYVSRERMRDWINCGGAGWPGGWRRQPKPPGGAAS